MRNEYFVARNKQRQTVDTDVLAERELKTLLNLIQISHPSFAPINKLFLDLGCGDQYLKSTAVQIGLRYVGLDIDDADFMCDQLPIDQDSVDIIGCYSVIEHLSDPSNLLNEAYRVLKPGGFLLIETPNWEYCTTTFYNDYTHVKPYTPTGLSALLSDFGFQIQQITPNVRCKPKLFYRSDFRFTLARLLPLRGFGGMFNFLKGRSYGVFCLVQKK